jgi:hypothetical protein
MQVSGVPPKADSGVRIEQAETSQAQLLNTDTRHLNTENMKP